VVRIEGDVPQRIFARGQDTPGLAMSRAVGDLVAHQVGVIHQPGIRRFSVEVDQCILCCSDGIWEFMKSAEAVKLVSQMGRDKVAVSVESLAQQARTQWLQEEEEVTDDMTVIAMWP